MIGEESCLVEAGPRERLFEGLAPFLMPDAEL
jgi:hypothetical protein